MRYRFLAPWKTVGASFDAGDTLDTSLMPIPNDVLAELLALHVIEEDLHRGTFVRDRMHRGIITKDNDDG